MFQLDETLSLDIINELVYEITLEYSFELHWLIKNGNLNLDELYNVQPIENEIEKNTLVDQINVKSNTSLIVACPVCLENVAGSRFAHHLEKCIIFLYMIFI
jgi:hypothetical protein